MLCKTVLKEHVQRKNKLKLVILGSTGSIGESALEICRSFPNLFEVLALSANTNALKLSEQAQEFKPKYAVLVDETFRADLKIPPASTALFGTQALCEIAALAEADVVLAAIVGIACLEAVLSSLHAGKKVALANKESVVCGAFLLEEALKGDATIIPVDSEHSSLFQCLMGRSKEEIAKLVLTASGGPFLNTPTEMLKCVSPAEAIKHPRWKMGAKISVDSASMMNKALEVIEAHWLFGIENIEVVVHPESIIHSLVSLCDGSMLAHLSKPDMRIPIAFGMIFPELRIPEIIPAPSLSEIGELHFMELDNERFPAVELAKTCIKSGASACAVLSIANEIAVEAFLSRKIRFIDIMPVNVRFLELFGHRACTSVYDLRTLCVEMREYSAEVLRSFIKN